MRLPLLSDRKNQESTEVDYPKPNGQNLINSGQEDAAAQAEENKAKAIIWQDVLLVLLP